MDSPKKVNQIIILMFLRSILKCSFTHTKGLPVPSFLDYKTDRYRSVHLTPKARLEQSAFKPYIENLMKIQIEGNKKTHVDSQTNSVWVHLKLQNLAVCQYLCQNGFTIHRGIGNQISLYRWIADQKDLVAPYSASYVSAGSILIKDQKIFVVQEKSGPRDGLYGIPGGRTDFGESISSCSQRELFEETNIKAQFWYMLHFRQLENTAYGAMDIYYACMMKYNNDAFDNIKLCQRQLRDYKWVPLGQYEEFAKKQSIGTQYQLARYISKLYKGGYNFSTRVPNQTIQQYYTSPIDKIKRQVIQHGLVEGFTIDKSYHESKK